MPTYYAVNDRCYESNVKAFEAYTNKFPIWDNGGYILYLNSATLDNGRIDYTFRRVTISSGSESNFSGQYFLNTCTELSAPAFDPVAAGAIWTFFFAFVVSLFVVSKSSGAIIEAVRKY